MSNSKIVLATALIAMLIAGFGIGLITEPLLLSHNTDPIWDNIVASGKIKIGCDPTWPPYESLDNSGNIIGFEIDLVNIIAEKLNLTTEWHTIPFGNIQALVENKSMDMGVSGFSITSNRLNNVAFTIPHSSTYRQILMTPSKMTALQISTLNSLDELKNLNMTIGVQSATTEIDELISVGANYKTFDNFNTAFEDLMSNNPSIDAVYAETPLTAIIDQYQAQGKTVTTIYEAPYYPCAFMTNTNAQIFTAKINGALTDIIASGQMDALKAKWNLT